MHITLFNAKKDYKIPLSDLTDEQFIFINKNTNNLKEYLEWMVKEHSMSKSLNLKEPIIKSRTIESLKEFFSNRVKVIVLDLDEISNKNDYYSVIDYFKDSGYQCILGKSRSWNGIDNFNIKGLLRVDLPNESKVIKHILQNIQVHLGGSAKVDLTVANNVSTQAPTNNSFIIHYNEKGKIISESDVNIEKIRELAELEEKSFNRQIVYNNSVIDKSLEIFFSLGFKLKSKSLNDNKSLNFSHYSEVKSKAGYFWFSSNPFIMHHHDKSKTISIFNLIKDTAEGREFLKNKTKDEQKYELIRPYNISKYDSCIITNERHLDFSDKSIDKKNLIKNFINSDKGVLKIKSPMGTAKSNGIDVIIKEAKEQNLNVILVSNRVSVAIDFADKYNIKLYKDPSSLHADSVVVQFDSLYKYDISKYDIVIFDEFMSLLLHHRSNLTDNSNINAVKFKILMDSKKVVIADAFLTGYEDNFFNNRQIFAIYNEYKDDINLFEYKDKNKFCFNIIESCKNLKDNEHISCSFTSLNVMRVIESELNDAGITVVSLSSETSDITRNIIYKKFKENTHDSFKVILFTPTLTVGVSNLNNVVKHFHYDSGMSTDVISSLQMIKRSRVTPEIHYYIEERQYYLDTSLDNLNAIAEKNINSFYNRKDKTLLVDIDYSTGNLCLTPLAKYINQIEVFYNVLANNHASAFRLLLDYQFKNPAKIIEDTSDFNLSSKTKIIKEKIKNETIDLINKYSSISWNNEELQEIKAKIAEKTDEEKAILLMGSVQDKFNKFIPQNVLSKLTKLEINSDFKFISCIKNMNIVLNKDDEYKKYRLSKAISSDIASLQNKHLIEFLEYLLVFDKKLESSYSKKEIDSIDIELNKGKKFEKFLKSLGYEWKDFRLKVNTDVFEYIEYI